MKNIEVNKKNFIDKANIVHNNKFDYSKINYITNKISIEIICPIHGEFFQAPGDHLKGYQCSKCSKKYKPTTEEWTNIAKTHYNGYYDYSKSIYIDNKTPLVIICPIHGEFLSIPINHLKDISGCPKCNNERKRINYSKGTERFVIEATKLHNNIYDYSKVSYINKKTPITIICVKHGEFKQLPSNHLNGSGCTKCNMKNQNILFNKLKKDFPNQSILWEYSPEWLKPQRFDIYFIDYNIAIEYHGQQHFYPIKKFGGEIKFEETLRNDKIKKEKCIDNNCYFLSLNYNYKEEDYRKIVELIHFYKIKKRDSASLCNP